MTFLARVTEAHPLDDVLANACGQGVLYPEDVRGRFKAGGLFGGLHSLRSMDASYSKECRLLCCALAKLGLGHLEDTYADLLGKDLAACRSFARGRMKYDALSSARNIMVRRSVANASRPVEREVMWGGALCASTTAGTRFNCQSGYPASCVSASLLKIAMRTVKQKDMREKQYRVFSNWLDKLV